MTRFRRPPEILTHIRFGQWVSHNKNKSIDPLVYQTKHPRGPQLLLSTTLTPVDSGSQVIITFISSTLIPSQLASPLVRLPIKYQRVLLDLSPLKFSRIYLLGIYFLCRISAFRIYSLDPVQTISWGIPTYIGFIHFEPYKSGPIESLPIRSLLILLNTSHSIRFL